MVTTTDKEPEIGKSSTVLLNSLFDTPKTSLLLFQFQPHLYESSISRLKSCSLKKHTMEDKSIYFFDDFFTLKEGKELQDFSQTTTFSRKSFGSLEGMERGEKPALSMNNKERWSFFSHPPKMVKEVYKFLSTVGAKLDVEVSLLPWELCDQNTGSPSVIANYLEEASFSSTNYGKHKDADSEKGIAFGIPCLYSENKEYHGNKFVNGDKGKPWLVSLILYATDKKFLPQYGMGTVFYDSNDQIVQADCLNSRMVLFEADIFHSISESKIPEGMKTFRVSYVLKLMMNPKNKTQIIREDFAAYIKSFSSKE